MYSREAADFHFKVNNSDLAIRAFPRGSSMGSWVIKGHPLGSTLRLSKSFNRISICKMIDFSVRTSFCFCPVYLFFEASNTVIKEISRERTSMPSRDEAWESLQHLSIRCCQKKWSNKGSRKYVLVRQCQSSTGSPTITRRQLPDHENVRFFLCIRFHFLFVCWVACWFFSSSAVFRDRIFYVGFDFFHDGFPPGSLYCLLYFDRA